MSRPGYSDRATLRAWADQRESDSEFPRLIRRLILETTPGLVELGVPAGDGVATGGWDGIVESTEGSVWVPQGKSLWELSTEESVGRKANEDYDKRVAEPLVADPSQHVYVAGSLRLWKKRDEWAGDKRAQSFWSGVRAYGLDKIETWIEDAPATWAWFSEQNGLTPYGIRTASAWWEAWSSQTDPVLSPEVVLAGRDANMKAVADRLGAGGFVATFGGPSRDEVCAFLAGCAVAQELAGNGDMLARTVFVDDIQAWRRLLDGQRPLILVCLDPEFANEVPPGSPHQVFVPTDRPDVAHMCLSPLDASVVRDVLKELGVEDDNEADEYGRLARRSLTTLRRRLGEHAALSNPDWSQHPVARATRACLLAGAWADASEGDQSALAELAGVEYDAFVEEAQALSGTADPLVSRLDGTWHLTDAIDAWSQLRGSVTSRDLERLTAVMSTVLGEVDPALELPQNERWWRAAFDGKQRTCSHHLRQGLANTLALLGEFGDASETAGGGTGADLASGVVRRLLADANGDTSGQRWASLSDLLPLLAEAAPDSFLDAVQEGLFGDDPLLGKIFTDDGDPLFGGGSPHTGLLWALETVAWSPGHLGQVIELLAKLAELDPGGRMSNRPSNSMVSIFRPWHPENTASDESRLRIIDAIRRRHSDVAWSWLMDLLPEFHSIHTGTYSPRFRDWKPTNISVPIAAYWAFISHLIARCIEDAGISVSRWLELIERMDNVPPTDRSKVLSALKARTLDDVFNEDGRTQIWDKLRSIVGRHRSFSHADWALPEVELLPIDELAATLAPNGARIRNRWIFDDYHPDLDDVKWTDDREGYNETLGQRRIEAIQHILEEEGLEGVQELAASLDQQHPWNVGVALADARPEFDDELLEPLGSEGDADRTMPWAYFARRFANDGWDWLETLLSTRDLTAVQRARLLLASSDFPAAWERGDEFGDEVATAFWHEFRQYGLGSDFEHVQHAAQRLMAVGRHAAALDLINIYSRKGQENRSECALLAAHGLEILLQAQPDENEMLVLANHGFESLLGLLEAERDVVGVERVANLEWAYLPALGFKPKIPSLEESLAESPNLFVQVISTVYRPRRDEGDEGSDEQDPPSDDDSAGPALAQNAYRLLSNWNRPPGMTEDAIDESALNEWVDEVVSKLGAARRLDVGLLHIGRILSAFPPGDDGVRPPREVRELIERLANRKIEEGFITQTMNSRGVTSRGLEDGGVQEEALVVQFRSDAVMLADEHPRSAAILRHLAESYEREARRNEASAERFRRGLH